MNILVKHIKMLVSSKTTMHLVEDDGDSETRHHFPAVWCDTHYARNYIVTEILEKDDDNIWLQVKKP